MSWLCGSLQRLSAEDRESRRRDRQITKQLREDRKRELRLLKLLLMGTGESGKSTILKQMKIIHLDGDGFSQEERDKYVEKIRKNLKDAIIALVAGMSLLRIDYMNKENIEKSRYILTEVIKDNYEYTEAFYEYVQDLWCDDGIQECFQRSNEYQLIDSAEYFIDNVGRIRNEDYSPTDQDILRCRVMTTAITSVEFKVMDGRHPVPFKVFDVGGQRGERKKWIQLFSEVTAILFICDCSSFTQRLREDRLKNRLLDSLEIFQQIWRNKYLQEVPVLVFINKIDVLEQRIRSGLTLDKFFEELDQDLHCIEENGRSSVCSCSASEPSRKYSRTSSTYEIPILLRTRPYSTFKPTEDVKKQFLHSYPFDEGCNYKQRKRSRSKDNPRVHPETIRTACYIHYVFTEVSKERTFAEYDPHFRRKCLCYFTCAVNTDNIQKVMDGCRAFLMDKHLEGLCML